MGRRGCRAEVLTGLAPAPGGAVEGPSLPAGPGRCPGHWGARRRAEVLTGLCLRLAEPLKGQACQQALDAALAIGDEWYRATVLIGLVPHLPVDLLPKALDAALAIGTEENRARALIGLAPHLPEPLKGQACQRALDAAQAIGRRGPGPRC